MFNLIWLFALPLIGSAILFLLPTTARTQGKWIAFFLSLIPLALLIIDHSNWIGASVRYPWFSALSIDFYLQVDSLSLVFLYLTALIIPITVIASATSSPALYGLILLLEALLVGFFTSRNLFIFTFFWEAMLLPLYFMINLDGGPKRESAAIKFLMYMLVGSVFMVAAILFLYFASFGLTDVGTFDLDKLSSLSPSLPHISWVGIIFFLAFAVKTPLFPFHAWLPETYTQASTSGTILLAALLSKAGIYGFLRIGKELFPFLMQEWEIYLLTLAIAGVFYGAFAAWSQANFKTLLAYSSFSHVNFILVGVFISLQISESGAILQAFNHGITIAGLFLTAGWLEDRLGSKQIAKSQGLLKYMPHLCWLTFIFILSSIALPSTNNFIGELLILFGLFTIHPWVTALLGLSIIFSVVYMLRWMQSVFFEKSSIFHPSWTDIRMKEVAIAFPLVFLVFWIGLYPTPLLNLTTQKTEKAIADTTTRNP